MSAAAKKLEAATQARIAEIGKTRKILVYGQPGTGKTYAIPTLISRLLAKYPETKFYIQDFDNGLEDVLLEFPKAVQEKAFENYYLCGNYESAIESFNEILTKIRPKDWYIGDMVGQVWDYAQDYYTRMVFKKSKAEFFTLMQKIAVEANQDIKKAKFDGWQQWPKIKGLHNTDIFDKVKMGNFNSLILSGAKPVNKDEREHSIYKQIGWVPEGEKHNHHRFKTILFLSSVWGNGSPEYYVNNTIKNRGRPLFKTTKIPAGWSALDVLMSMEKKLGKKVK